MTRTCGKEEGGSDGEGHPGGRRKIGRLGSDGSMTLKRISVS